MADLSCRTLSRISFLTVRSFPAAYTMRYSYLSKLSQRLTTNNLKRRSLFHNFLISYFTAWYVSILYLFVLSIHALSISTPVLSIFERAVVGVSVGLRSVRRFFLITPRMKCHCPHSVSAMIGHAHSVERLYLSWGKHELQSSRLWGVSTLNSALAMTGQTLLWISWVFSLGDSRLACCGLALLFNAFCTLQCVDRLHD